MRELSTGTRLRGERLIARAAWLVRRLAASALMVVAFVVTFAVAGVIALAALVVALIVAGGIGVMWILARLAGPRRSASPRTLEARKGPRGWTVETRRFSV